MKTLTQAEKKIKYQNLIDDAFWRLNNIKIPIERFVIVEKWNINGLVCVSSEECEYEDYIFGGLHISSFGFFIASWHNSAGQLHSFNDMPSKISWNASSWIEAEWHKNGQPYRKNFKFNKIIVRNDDVYSVETGGFVSGKKTIEFLWLNKKGELNSFNDAPAQITAGGIYWYRNGILCRRSYNSLSDELPCVIDKLGNMAFCKNKDDSTESIKYPFSTKYYGQASKLGLNQYEMYVEWPIRELLTL